MTKNLDITLAQINPTVGDLEGNAAMIEAAWNDHKDADLIIFPELCLCGYPPEDLVLKPSFIEGVKTKIQNLAAAGKNHKAAIIIGAPYAKDGKLYNAAHLIHEGKVAATVTKHHLPNYGVFDEARVFAPGPLPAPVEFKGHKLGLMICEDMWFADVATNLKAHGAEILIVPNGSPFDAGKHGARLTHARSRVKETGLPLLYVNQIGGQDELVFDGGSFAMDGDGQITDQFCFFETEVRPSHMPSFRRKPESGHLQHEIPAFAGMTEEERTYNALKLGLRDYIEKNNFPGILLGLSGGIDSAISAVIAADALGPEKVHAIMMPSRYTSQDSLDDADELAKNLGIRLDTIPIEESVEAIGKAITDFAKPENSPVTFENIQSRARGLILMALSNATGKMVLSTGNKSEMAVGYATLYGDMNGGFNVLKDVYKTQVYALSNWRNEQGYVIPPRIITKAPTAELKDNQTDQDSLPPYEDLDVILHAAIEEEKSSAEIIKMGYAPETVHKVLTMLSRAEYKRRQAPPGVKTTARAFGRERRYPITNGFKNI